MDIIQTDIKGKQVMKVKVFNRIKEDKFYKDLEIWKSKNRFGFEGMPYLPMYIFTKANGVPYIKGYVVSEGDSHRFYHTREEVFINEGLRK